MASFGSAKVQVSYFREWPRLPTSAVAQAGSYLGYTGRGANLVLTAMAGIQSPNMFAYK